MRGRCRLRAHAKAQARPRFAFRFAFGVTLWVLLRGRGSWAGVDVHVAQTRPRYWVYRPLIRAAYVHLLFLNRPLSCCLSVPAPAVGYSMFTRGPKFTLPPWRRAS